jgi:fructosamine-3-kinase
MLQLRPRSYRKEKQQQQEILELRNRSALWHPNSQRLWERQRWEWQYQVVQDQGTLEEGEEEVVVTKVPHVSLRKDLLELLSGDLRRLPWEARKVAGAVTARVR